jgi:hypothetical protein
MWGRGFEPPNLLKDRISLISINASILNVLSPADLTRLSYPHMSRTQVSIVLVGKEAEL